MKYFTLILLFFVSQICSAQIYHDRIGFDLESIADLNIGWMEMRNHTAVPQGKQNGKRIYSAKQIGYSQQFVEWMQQSYTPKGVLGRATYFQNYIYKFSSTNSMKGNAINELKDALPLSYGALTTIYIYLKKDEKGNFVPQNNLSDSWAIEANQLKSISTPVSFISNANDYYFLLTNYKLLKSGYPEYAKTNSNLFGFDENKNIKPFLNFYSNGQYIVILTKGNAPLPFEKITIGEFLIEAEKQFPKWQKIENLPAETFVAAQKNLARLKEKYKSKWNDVAQLQLPAQIDLYDFVNAKKGSGDMLDKSGCSERFPILRVKKEALELCKRDEPQWITVRWSISLPNEKYARHFHESILNNFNFQYLYNFFFASEKIKGQAYKPLRSPN